MQKLLIRVIPLLGISSYWSWTTIDRGGFLGFGGFSSGIDPFITTGLTVLASILLLPASTYLKKPAVWKTIRIFFAATALLASLGLGIAYLDRSLHLLLYISTLLLAVLRAGTLIFWLIWLISKNREGFSSSFSISIALLTFFFLLSMGLPTDLGFVLFLLLIACSGVALLGVSEIDIASQNESNARPKYTYRALTGFVAVRFLLGFSVGLFAVLNPMGDVTSLNSAARIMATVLSLCPLALVLLFWKKASTPTVICAPLVLILLAVAPTMLEWNLLAQTIIAPLFIASTFVSATHLFRNIGLMDMGLPPYVAIAQFTAATGTFVGNNILSWWGHYTPVTAFPHLQMSSSFLIFLLLVVFTQFLLARIIIPDEPLGKQGRTQQAVHQLSKRFGLTAREQDVLELLAEGYSRPYISEKLFLSLSTVKTHVNHLYLKMGINRRDDLLKKINDEQPHNHG
jgi:DNA-binding CsgD family transcriptional regulator